MIKAPSARMAGDDPPGPTRLALGIAVKLSKRIAVAQLAKSRNYGKFSLIPFDSSLRPKPAAPLNEVGQSGRAPLSRWAVGDLLECHEIGLALR